MERSGEMRQQQTFEASTKAGAEALAENWIKSHPGCRVIDSKAAHTSTMKRDTSIGSGGTWTLVLEYDDEPKPL
jgi:hypothetical protein